MANLKPGDKLRWKHPEPNEDWYVPLYTLWENRHGEEVEFVEYASKEKGDLCEVDKDWLPILRVRTRVGLVTFSTGFFTP